jgi:hypothetical protein
MSGPDGGPAAGASFYALGPEFDWLASAWDGFARDLADTGGTLRHVVAAAAADPRLAAESSGLAALESATDRLVRELVDDAARIRRTLATYESADAAVQASVPDYASPQDGPFCAPGYPEPSGGHARVPLAMSGGSGTAVPPQALWRPGHGDAYGGDAYGGDSYGEGSYGGDSYGGTAAPGGGSTGFDTGNGTGPAAQGGGAVATLSQARRDILARAERWVTERVPYDQGVWHEGYRTDCSGYVSMCWGLGSSLVTSTMPQVAHPVAKQDLRPGDVLLNTDVATGHVILFDRWADYAHSAYVGFELCPQGTLHHVIPYPYYAGFGNYEPYRYNRAGE